jgi:hypothetical protein
MTLPHLVFLVLSENILHQLECQSPLRVLDVEGNRLQSMEIQWEELEVLAVKDNAFPKGYIEQHCSLPGSNGTYMLPEEEDVPESSKSYEETVKAILLRSQLRQK